MPAINSYFSKLFWNIMLKTHQCKYIFKTLHLLAWSKQPTVQSFLSACELGGRSSSTECRESKTRAGPSRGMAISERSNRARCRSTPGFWGPPWRDHRQASGGWTRPERETPWVCLRCPRDRRERRERRTADSRPRPSSGCCWRDLPVGPKFESRISNLWTNRCTQ